MPGKLSYGSESTVLSCRPVDVSKHGIGVIMDTLIETETELHLQFENRTIRLKVAWSQPDFGRRDLFRYGLVCLDTEEDLESLFTKTGCLV